MLIPYPEKRISAKEALNHEWLNALEDDNCRMTNEELYEYNLKEGIETCKQSVE